VEDQSGPRNVKKNNFIHPSIEGPIAIFVGVIDIISKCLSYPSDPCMVYLPTFTRKKQPFM